MIDKDSNLATLISIGVLSSLGGLASLLRSGKNINPREVFAALLNSGLIGIVIALLWWNKFGHDNLYFLVGVSGLAGIGGASVIDLAVQWYAQKFFGASPNQPKGDDHANQ